MQQSLQSLTWSANNDSDQWQGSPTCGLVKINHADSASTGLIALVEQAGLMPGTVISGSEPMPVLVSCYLSEQIMLALPVQA